MSRKKSPADELRELIAAAGLNQTTAAEALGMSRRMLQYNLSGSHEIETRTLLAMRWLAHERGTRQPSG